MQLKDDESKSLEEKKEIYKFTVFAFIILDKPSGNIRIVQLY
jgi:hypothetical protein